MELSVTRELIPLSAPFTITGYTFNDIAVVVARVSERGAQGSGEAAGVYYLGDDVEHMCADIERVRRDVEAGVDREALRQVLPPGGARNALDCALWELDSKVTGRPVWQIAGIEKPTLLVPGNNETDEALREACASWPATRRSAPSDRCAGTAGPGSRAVARAGAPWSSPPAPCSASGRPRP